jgi:hypothetical protein
MNNTIKTNNLDKIIKSMGSIIDKRLKKSSVFIHNGNNKIIYTLDDVRHISHYFSGHLINDEFVFYPDSKVQLSDDDIESVANDFANFIMDSTYNDIIFLTEDHGPYMYNSSVSCNGIIITWILKPTFSLNCPYFLDIKMMFIKIILNT